MPTTSAPIHQAAAIPIREGRICLVTSSGGNRWVVPKGHLEPGKTAGEIALQEAWEEAGIVGILQQEPIGSYLYEKFGNLYHVVVFVMRVTESVEEWPEYGLRNREWVTPEEALTRISDKGLRELIWAVARRDGITAPTAG